MTDRTAHDDTVARISALLEAGAFAEAEAAARAAAAANPESAPILNLLGAACFAGGDAVQAALAFGRALSADPSSGEAEANLKAVSDLLRARYQTALADIREAADEDRELEAAYRALSDAVAAEVLDEGAVGFALAVFLRIVALDDAEALGSFREVGRSLARHDNHRCLLYQLPRVESAADRTELLVQHRLWGEAAEARAAARPVRPAPRGPRSRIRLGLLSADLRRHAVGAFAEPLLAFADRERFEVYGYSNHPGAPDAVQQSLADRADAFRLRPGATAEGMAQLIADDAPDILIELGGSTGTNQLKTMAHRLAPVQASWLGYPHSAGLSTIDHLVVDRFTAPLDPALILERPLLMPRTWVTLSPGYFSDELRPATALPEEKNRAVTFGSANSTYKCSAATLDAWARCLAAVPGSRFLMVRPEGASPTFRRNVAGYFARHGVAPNRLMFAPVRGAHLPLYGEIDIALDTLPLTGGMTTAEALWMGVPVVSLAGPAVFERLSHSLLNNAGLGDLSVDSVEAYVAKAVELAGDRPRRRAWRADCRAEIRARPLGDAPGFARDFYDLLAAL
jgi:predicted O-linked N-acetylglucosamine transferase (SPINDLY family)